MISKSFPRIEFFLEPEDKALIEKASAINPSPTDCQSDWIYRDIPGKEAATKNATNAVTNAAVKNETLPGSPVLPGPEGVSGREGCP